MLTSLIIRANGELKNNTQQSKSKSRRKMMMIG